MGLPPGSLIHLGEKRSAKTKISVMNYSDGDFLERADISVEECIEFKKAKGVAWIDIEGVHEVDKLAAIGEAFGLHPLVMEDIANTDQRPKMEDYGEYIYVVMQMLCIDEGKNEIIADQVSIILGKNFVLSFQEGELDVFEPLRGRIKTAKGRVRKMGAGYLAYSLIDAIVDSYFLILEKFGDKIDTLEDELIGSPSPTTLRKIHTFKRDMFYLRRSIWPLRELVAGLDRSESGLLGDYLHPYIRDIHDHAIYLIDAVETFRDMLSGMLDIYLSSINNRMNEVMKVLTMIATLFMPLTFIAGIYGMNFEYMPELRWKIGYPMILTVMSVIVIFMFLYFKKKKWVGAK